MTFQPERPHFTPAARFEAHVRKVEVREAAGLKR